MRRICLQLFLVFLAIGSGFGELKLIPLDDDFSGAKLLVYSDEVEKSDAVEVLNLVNSNSTADSTDVLKEFEEDYSEDQNEDSDNEDDEEGSDGIGVWTFQTDTGETGVVDSNNITDHVMAYNERAPRNCPSCRCGVKFSQRIVGGTITAKYAFPWLGFLQRNGKFVCAVSLISNRYVVTAAHCVRRRPNAYRVVLHVYNRFNPESSARYRRVSRIYTKNYNGFNRDFALLRLRRHVTLGVHVRPVCLPRTSRRTFIGTKAVTVGWGRKAFYQLPKYPHKLLMPVRRKRFCSFVAAGRTLTRFEMCAGYSYGGPGTCKYDGGDPLMLRMRGKLFLIGVNSWRKCGVFSRGPTIFARVNQFLNFIRTVTQDSCYCNH